MSLRLDGGDEIDKSIGTVLYSSKDNAITAIKGDTDKDVSLIIQCKVDGTDKYISVRITDGYIAKLDKDSGYDVSQCKIWLEIPVDDGSTLAYAVEATEHDHTLGDKPEKFDEQWHGYKCIDEECPVPGGYFENLEEHIWGEDNLCDICDYRKGDHIPHKVNETQPTRTNVGYREHFECRHCDKWFVYPATLGVLDEKPRSYFEIPYTDKKTSSSGSSSNINTGWIKDSKGWRFRNSDGTLAQGTTVTDADGGKAQVVLLATYMQGFK